MAHDLRLSPINYHLSAAANSLCDGRRVGPQLGLSLPVTLLATAALPLFADIIGRVIVPGELRVSVVSAFIGAPVLIFLVRRKTRGGA